jgi:hypothetical protein
MKQIREGEYNTELFSFVPFLAGWKNRQQPYDPFLSERSHRDAAGKPRPRIENGMRGPLYMGWHLSRMLVRHCRF